MEQASKEHAIAFDCEGSRLIGILHCADVPSRRGILLVVGGPQYRVGSHRQFALLARHCAAHGIPVLRFDYRGMGDSCGPTVSFEEIGPDIRAAVETFMSRCPEIDEIVIWGLCDAASAALFYAPDDSRVKGLVLLNPWVRTEQGLAKSYLRHYYLRHILAKDFWVRLLTGRVGLRTAADSLVRNLRVALSPRVNHQDEGPAGPTGPSPARPLPERMAESCLKFQGRILLVLSGDDLTAAEFKQAVQLSKRWRRALGRAVVDRRDLPPANHTFGRREWRDRVADWTVEWMKSW